jgi:hypothetical protein
MRTNDYRRKPLTAEAGREGFFEQLSKIPLPRSGCRRLSSFQGSNIWFLTTKGHATSGTQPALGQRRRTLSVREKIFLAFFEEKLLMIAHTDS